MDLDGYVDRLRTEFASVSAVAGPEVQEIAERLVSPLAAATRLILLEALASAADEITFDLAPGSVHLRLRGSDPDFVVTPAPADEPEAPVAPVAPVDAAAPVDPEGGPTARINFRPSEHLKNRIEEAAGRDGLSVNTWLARVATAALDAPPRPAAPSHSPRGRTVRGGWFA